ncbi:MAG: Gfo/Idh/MocA family oxidoreductase [Chloroflexi bacterium]|nr:Gfo/Idh/MocA family oxidoreductase [Chloroflexota bacterium]
MVGRKQESDRSGAVRKRAIMVGAGGFAGVWIREFLPVFEERLEVVALVDQDPLALGRGAGVLGLRPEQTFIDMARAFGSVDADFAILAIPPGPRLRAVALAAERHLAVLCEKPLADSWNNSLAVLRLAEQADLKLSVVQNYRYSRRIMTLKWLLHSGALGELNTIAVRFAVDFRVDTAGGAFRHGIPDAMLYEGAVHHFDQLRNLGEADAAWISGRSWNRAWSTFANDCCAEFMIGLENGVIAHYEMNNIARGQQHGWHQEGVRIEAEGGSVVLDADGTVRTIRHLGQGHERVADVPQVEIERDEHFLVISEFLDWLDGGPVPSTEVHDNIRTAALAFGAVEASRTGTVVDVADMLARAGVG